MLTVPERRVLRTFRQYRILPGKMLCFNGQSLKANRPALEQLAKKELIVKEQFKGGYSLTQAGFAAMKEC